MKNLHWSVLVIAGLCGLLLAQGDAYASGKKGWHRHIVKKGEFCIKNHAGQRANATVFLKGGEGRKLKHAFRHLSNSEFISEGSCEASPSGRVDHIKIALKWKDWGRWGHFPKAWRRDRDKGTNVRRDSRSNNRFSKWDRRSGHDGDKRFLRHGSGFVEVGKPHGPHSDGQFGGLLGYLLPVIASLDERDPWGIKRSPHRAPRIGTNRGGDVAKGITKKRSPHRAPRIWTNRRGDVAKAFTGRYWIFAKDQNNPNI
jgi:hypothetical protein